MADRRGIGVIVPSLRPDAHLINLVVSLSEAGFQEIVIVNDGSEPSFDPIFEEAGALGCTVLRHEVNQGKGRALKTAFKYFLDSAPGVLGVVTCDADGQHSAEDIAVIADRLATNRQRDVMAVVWGSRDFGQPEIPWKSRFGNKASSLLVKLVCGSYIRDTQTGLRGFPLELLEPIKAVKGERFEYEMNVLTMLLKRRVVVEEIPIDTIYHDSKNTQSHFRPIRDSIHVIVQLGRFMASSFAGSVVDLLLYAALVNWMFDGRPDSTGIMVAVALARVVSSFVNFMLNREWVFGSGASRWASLARYYSLAVLILGSSAVGSAALAQFMAGHVVWAKIVVDTVLFAVSFVIQKRWVFSDESPAVAES